MGKAFVSLREMKEIGVDRDLSTYNEVIRACSEKVKRWQQALSVLQKLEASGPAPDRKSFNWVIACCGKAGEWRRAIDILESMRGRALEPDEDTFVLALHACRGGALWQEAVSLIVEMQERGFELG